MSPQWGIDADLMAMGVLRVFNRAHQRLETVATCACGNKIARHFKPTACPDMVASVFSRAGWKFPHHHAPVCPSCGKKKGKVNAQVPNTTGS